jgi:EAL domain-containing protein (putative c-di-GMP-specific phosphodiesterase class I)
MSHILVVDDDAGIRRMLQFVLQRSGHNVEQAQDGAEALRKAVKGQYDAAVVDFRMPPPDGLELLSQLRNLQPRCVRVLMSGTLDVPVVMEAVNRGEVSRVIQKPFRRQTIVSALEEAIAARRRLEGLYIGAQSEAFETQRLQLEECLGEQVLTLALQPIVTAGARSLFAYEALLRSSHPVLDSPARVMAAAEAHDRLDRIADVVAYRAATVLNCLPADINLFINVHPGELADVERVQARFEPLTAWAKRIVVEITERSDLLQIINWRRAIDFLIGAGFRLAVDDLGSGYNSLSVLAELQPAFVKADMSIVRNVDRDERKQRLVELLSRFVKATNAQLIVEGIESEAEAETVCRLGADLLQGYLFGKPSPR